MVLQDQASKQTGSPESRTVKQEEPNIDLVACRWALITILIRFIINITEFTWLLFRDKKLRLFIKRGETRPSQEQLNQFWRATQGCTSPEFAMAIKDLTTCSRDIFEKTILEPCDTNLDDEGGNPCNMKEGQTKNVLEMILSKDPESAEEFYEILRKSMTDWEYCKLIESSTLPDYATNNPRLIAKISTDCQYIFLAVPKLFCLKGKYDKTLLHVAAEMNNFKEQPGSHLENLMKSLEVSSAGCHMLIDFSLLVLSLNLISNSFLGTEGWIHCMALAAQFLLYSSWSFYSPLSICSFLKAKDSQGNTVLHLSAKNGCSELLINFITENASLHPAKVWMTFSKKVRRDLEETCEHKSGFVAGLVTLSAFYFALYLHDLEDGFWYRTIRNISITSIVYLWKSYGDVPGTFMTIGYVYRFFTHIFYIWSVPGHWLSILPLVSDMLVPFVVMYIVRLHIRKELRSLMNDTNSLEKHFLHVATASDILLWLSNEDQFIREEANMLVNGMLLLHWADRHPKSEDVNMLPVIEGKEWYDILETYKQIFKIRYLYKVEKCVITDPRRVTVFSLSTRQSEQSGLRYITENLVKRRRYFGPDPDYDLHSSTQICEKLADHLSSLQPKHRAPDMLLVFIEADGNDRTFSSDEGKDVTHFQKLINLFGKEFDHFPKWLIILTTDVANQQGAYSKILNFSEMANFGLLTLSGKHNISDGKLLREISFRLSQQGDTDVQNVLWAFQQEVRRTELRVELHYPNMYKAAVIRHRNMLPRCRNSEDRLERLVISNPEDVAVLTLAVVEDRLNADSEINHVHSMAKERKFLNLGTSRILHANQFTRTIKEKLLAMRRNHPNIKSVLLFIMAHGELGFLHGAKDLEQPTCITRVPIQNLIDLFKDKRLHHIQKFLFIQACQVAPAASQSPLPPSNITDKPNVDSEVNDPGLCSEAGFDFPQSIPNLALILVTQFGTVALRNTFIDFFCYFLAKTKHETTDMQSILWRVNQAMSSGFGQFPMHFQPYMEKATTILPTP